MIQSLHRYSSLAGTATGYGNDGRQEMNYHIH